MIDEQEVDAAVERLRADLALNRYCSIASVWTGDLRLILETLAAVTRERAAIIEQIPMAYLVAHDNPGATGPTKALDLVGAMRAYAKARWAIIDRCRLAEAQRDAAASLAEATKERCDHAESLWKTVEAQRDEAVEALEPFGRRVMSKDGRWVEAPPGTPRAYCIPNPTEDEFDRAASTLARIKSSRGAGG